MKFDLPTLDGTRAPAFNTVADCKHWLGEQTLTNPANVQRQLCDQIDMLNRQAVVLRERFGILETLQQQITFVQEEAAKKFAAKPLPYLKPEAEAFAASKALWRALGDGYLRSLEHAVAEKANDHTLATIVERVMAVLYSAQLDRVRGFAVADARHWSHLHQLLAFAEESGIATMATQDKMRYGDQTVTPLSVYAECVLLHAASANEFSARPLTWVVRWARRWAAKLVLLRDLPLDLQAVPINVDLASSLPPGPFPIKDAVQPRFLGTLDLANSLKTRLAALAEGRSPSELHLGDDCTQPGCEQMLQRLYQRWCKGGMDRPADRHVAKGTVELSAGLEAVWFYLAGKPFKQPRSADDALLRREREELAAFGRISDRHDAAQADKAGFRYESDWNIVNESPSGLRLLRSAMTADSLRVNAGQLIALRKTGSKAFQLGVVRWLLVDSEGLLHAGVHLISGATPPIMVHPAGINAIKEPWRPAFVLAANQPIQLLLPGGMFRPDRVMDAEGGPVKQFKLVTLIERGEDYEKIAVA